MITYTTRRDLDFYPTDPMWLQPLLRREKFEGVIHEPCCGNGDLVLPLRRAGYQVEASDIARYGGHKVIDALELKGMHNVLTNPPYLLAEELIRHWLAHATGKVSVLVRLGFLEGIRRSDLYRNHPPKSIILVPVRMKVFGKASQFPHVWVTWDRGFSGPTIFQWADPTEVLK